MLGQACLCLTFCSEHTCLAKALLREHFKHPKHSEQHIRASYDRTGPESDSASNPAHRTSHVSQILRIRYRSHLAQVQQDIQLIRTVGISLQHTKMIDHFCDRHSPDAFGTNE